MLGRAATLSQGPTRNKPVRLAKGIGFDTVRSAFYTDFFARGRQAAAEEPKPLEMKRTFQPNTRKRRRTHGFLVRMRSKGGRLVLKRRRQKGRSRIGAD